MDNTHKSIARTTRHIFNILDLKKGEKEPELKWP